MLTRFLTALSIFLLFTACQSDNILYLDENGITLKARPGVLAGEKAIIDGIEYTVVDSSMLYSMVDSGKDVTKVITTLITNMSELFVGQYDFNQDISSWDVSNVSNMNAMFGKYLGENENPKYYLFNQDISNWDVKRVTRMGGMF